MLSLPLCLHSPDSFSPFLSSSVALLSLSPSVCLSPSLWLSHAAAAAAAAKSLQFRPTLRPQRQQPTRLPHPWDSPGKNTGVAISFSNA